MTHAQPGQLQADQNQSLSSGDNNVNSNNPSNPAPISASSFELPVRSDNTQPVPILDNLPANNYLPIALRKGKKNLY